MSAPRGIPGFYYGVAALFPSNSVKGGADRGADESKKKYFRIQPGYRAPKKARYTYDSIRDEAAAKELRRKTAEQAARSRRRRGILSDAMTNPLIGGMYHLELGLGGLGDRKRVLMHCFASDMKAKTALKAVQGSKVQKFRMNERTGHMLLGMKAPSGKTGLWLSKDALWPSADLTDSSGLPIGMDSPAYFAKSEITSINTGSTGTTISTILGGAERAEIHLMANWSDDTFAHVVLFPGGEQSVRTSAASKFNGTLAAGLDKSVIVVRESQGSWAEQSFLVPSNVFAMDFLNCDTLVYGCRNGGVQLFDLRTHKAGFVNFRHSSAVTHIRRVDENRLIINGLQNSLCMYDLRYTRVNSLKFPIGRDSPNSSPRTTAVSPVVTYDYRNDYHLGLGFDIDTEYGVAATAQADCTVQIFCLDTGRKVSQFECEDRVGCMQFARFKDGHTSLLVSAGNGIRGYET